MTKIMTIIGTRPEIIRLSRVIPALDNACEHILIHTGQNHSHNLNDLFFEELGIRKPDHYMDAAGTSFSQTIGQIIQKTADVLEQYKPDKLLILGDTDSGLSSIVAKRMGIPVYHMEAGNRCFDNEVPEEVNRRIIDSCSDILMPYTRNSRDYLLQEGYQPKSIVVTGNPIHEVIDYYMPSIEKANPLKKLDAKAKDYFLVTLHRAENVDKKDSLQNFMNIFDKLSSDYNKYILISVHPRMRKRLDDFGIKPKSNKIKLIDAFGFFDFIHLQKNSYCVLSDSGTVPEECAILNIPCVLLRKVTERPELLEVGSFILAGSNPDTILNAVKNVTQSKIKQNIPDDYKSISVSQTVTRLIVGGL